MKRPALFDANAGLLAPAAYASSAVYQDEMTRLFRRAWLMVGPASWVSGSTGEFFTTTMGPEPVLVWRDAAGEIRVFENRCVGGEVLLTEAERGAAECFICRCHGWRYGLVDRSDEMRPDELPHVEQRGGLVFANADLGAPSLDDWFGEFDWYWALVLHLFDGRIEAHGEAVLRTRLGCNWKLAVEAWCGDLYSDLTLGRATQHAVGDAARPSLHGFQASAGGGAMVVSSAPAQGTAPSEAQSAELFPLTATLFPNLSFDGRTRTLHVWHPRGPAETEVHTYCLSGSAEAIDVIEARRRRAQLLFGPAGLKTQDHENVWRSITRASRGRIAQRSWLNLQMGLGRERITNLPGRVGDLVSEMNQRAFYGWWQACLAQDPLIRSSQKLRLRPGHRDQSARRG